MTGLDEQRLARAALTYLAEPADPALGALLAICEPAEVVAAVKADMLPGTGPGCGDSPASRIGIGGGLPGRHRLRRARGRRDRRRPRRAGLGRRLGRRLGYKTLITCNFGGQL